MKKPTVKKPPQCLAELGALYEERGKVYGDNYKQHGPAMLAIFPNGITLRTADDHNRFGVFTQVFCKVTRYANMFERGGHEDTLDDITVYSQMLQELDREIKSRKAAVGRSRKGNKRKQPRTPRRASRR